MEDYTGKIHNLIFLNVYDFPGVPKLLIIPQKWARDRGEDELRKEGTCLKVTGKSSVLELENGKPQRTMIHAPGFALPETSI